MGCGDEENYWKFFCFRTNDRRASAIREWVDDLDKSESKILLSELRVFLKKLRSRRKEKWVRPDFAPITGNKKWRNLHEIRIDINKKKYRIIGCFGPGECEFTMLVPGIKIKPDFYKLNCPKAIERMSDVRTSEGRIVEFKFTGNLE